MELGRYAWYYMTAVPNNLVGGISQISGTDILQLSTQQAIEL